MFTELHRKKTKKGNVTVTKEDVTLLAFLEEHKFSLEYSQDEYGLSWEVTDGNDPTWYPRVVGRGVTVKEAIEDAIKHVEQKKGAV
jgi:DNA-directed RNA polymerase subunit L